MEEDKEFDEESAEETGAKELSQLTRLHGTEKLKKHIELMNISRQRPAPAPYTKEHKEDYDLVCESNDLAYELEQETMALTTWVRQNYSPRFPELEALIQNHMDYVRTVRRLGPTPSCSPRRVCLATTPARQHTLPGWVHSRGQ
jgi:RNA processing factor Prp31